MRKSNELAYNLGKKMAMVDALLFEAQQLFATTVDDTRELLDQIDEEERDAKGGEGRASGPSAREEGSRNEGSRKEH